MYIFERAVLNLRRWNSYATSDDVTTAWVEELAETLVFYDTVYVVGTSEELGSMILRVGFSSMASLCAQHRVVLRLQPTTATASVFQDDQHLLVRPSDWRFDYGDPAASLGRMERNFSVLGKPGLTELLEAIGSNWTHPDTESETRAIEYVGKVFVEQVTDDPSWINAVATALLRSDAPQSSVPFKVAQVLPASAQNDRPYIAIRRGLELRATKRITMAREYEPIGAETVVERTLDVVHQLALASTIGGEFSVAPLLHDALTLGIGGSVARAIPSQDLGEFQKVVFFDARAIGQAVAGRPNGFEELAELLTKKGSFSAWLRGKSPDQSILEAYIAHLRDGTWLDRAPTRVMRFAFFTTAGLMVDAVVASVTGIAGYGTTAGVALGALDSFVIDRILKGWTPTSFIHGPLTKLITEP